MNSNLVSAVFDSHSEADRAVSELRAKGVRDSAISIVAQRDGKNMTTDGRGEEDAGDTAGKVAAGAGVGAILGIAALAIPGVGPLVAAGAIAETAIGGAALTGAAIGGAGGGLASILKKHGVHDDDAGYYEERINSGGTFVSVDTSDAGVDRETASDILYRAGGHNAGRSKIGMTA